MLVDEAAIYLFIFLIQMCAKLQYYIFFFYWIFFQLIQDTQVPPSCFPFVHKPETCEFTGERSRCFFFGQESKRAVQNWPGTHLDEVSTKQKVTIFHVPCPFLSKYLFVFGLAAALFEKLHMLVLSSLLFCSQTSLSLLNCKYSHLVKCHPGNISGQQLSLFNDGQEEGGVRGLVR